MQRWWPSRQIGRWQGRQASAPEISTISASGLSGAQCHGLVGPKMPIAGVSSAAATCSRPEIVRNRDIGGRKRQDGIAQLGSGEVADAGAVATDDLCGDRLLARPTENPYRMSGSRELGGQLAIGRRRPTLGGADRAGSERDNPPPVGGNAHAVPPACEFSWRNPQLWGREVPWYVLVRAYSECNAAVDHARQLALAETQVVDESEAGLAHKAGAYRNSRQQRRQRRLPRARHDQGLTVSLRS